MVIPLDISLPVKMEDVRDWIENNRYVRELGYEVKHNKTSVLLGFVRLPF